MTSLQKTNKHDGHKGNALHLLTFVYFVSFVFKYLFAVVASMLHFVLSAVEGRLPRFDCAQREGKMTGAGDEPALVYFKTDYLVKTLSAESQMVAPKSSTVVAPVKTPWMAGPMI